MKYFTTNFALTAESADIIAPATDILQSLLAETGYEAFQDDTDAALTESLALLKDYRKEHPLAPFCCFSAYVQQSLYDEESLKDCIASMPFDGVYIYYCTREAEDKNWNEQWESEQEQSEICRQLGITIDVKQAFGTGGHFTTRMIATALTEQNLSGKTVLDCGCGSGILSIAALKLGAAHATAYDIDEWSVNNTRHNAELNGITAAQLTVLEGDVSVIDNLDKTETSGTKNKESNGEKGNNSQSFDIILANINRNILLNDLPHFASHLKTDGILMLSGFYTADAPLLTAKAEKCGLTLQGQRHEEDWCMLLLNKLP